MKIAVIAPSAIPSNTANSIQVMKVCQAFVQSGFEVCLWVPGRVSKDWNYLSEFYGLSRSFEIKWIKSIHFFHRYDFACLSLLQAKKWNPNLLYTWMPQAGVLGCLFRIPTALEVHMLPSGFLGPSLYRAFLKSRGKKRLLPITNALYLRLEQTLSLKIPSDIVRIAPMGYDPAQYDNLPDPRTARQELGLPINRIIAGYSGHLYPGRGMDILVGLAKAYPSVHFIWNGGREQDVNDWKTIIAEAGIPNITMTGFVSNARLPLYQAASDILLMPYERTIGVSSQGNTADVCSPMKMFDYLAAGRAILSSDLPVFHEVLNEKNAMFCPPGELEAWINAFGHLIQDANYRKQLSRQAREDANQYSWVSRVHNTLSDFIE